MPEEDREMRSLIAVAAIALLVAGIAGCECAYRASVGPAAETQAMAGTSARGRGRLKANEDMVVSTDWLARRLDDEDVVIFDLAASRERYEAAHIPGAVYVGWDEVSVERGAVPGMMPSMDTITALIRRAGIDEGDRIVVYGGEEAFRAARLYAVVDYAGLGDRTALLDGQLAKWRFEDRPTESGEPEAIAQSVYTPSFNPEVIVSMTEVRDAVWLTNNLPDAPVALIDARPVDQFTGETPGDAVTRAGHIPGAHSVPWQRNFEGGTEAVLSPVDDLRRLYADEADLRPGDTPIAYCRTGGQSALTYFALKYIGYEAKLYDGSFVEWSMAQNNPVARGTELAAQLAE
jgi:thiosulfate/3-mercaptopyruvate sulfurtransferase